MEWSYVPQPYINIIIQKFNEFLYFLIYSSMTSYHLTLAQGQYDARKAWVTSYEYVNVMSEAENKVIEFEKQKGC